MKKYRLIFIITTLLLCLTTSGCEQGSVTDRTAAGTSAGAAAEQVQAGEQDIADPGQEREPVIVLEDESSADPDDTVARDPLAGTGIGSAGAGAVMDATAGLNDDNATGNDAADVAGAATGNDAADVAGAATGNDKADGADAATDNSAADVTGAVTGDAGTEADIEAKQAEENDSAADKTADGATNKSADGEADAGSAGTEEKTTESTAGGTFTKSELTDDIKARINGISYPAGCTVAYDELRYLRVSYVDFSGRSQVGELICNRAIADDLLDIFSQLYAAGYQIEKIRLVDEYGGDDTLSITDNNTSCFNYRVVEGTTSLSKHALGRAIDLNPFYNPYVTYPNGNIRISPPGSEPYAERNWDFPHKIDKNDLAYKLFKQHGFTWGGDWKTLKDYQHFQKT